MLPISSSVKYISLGAAGFTVSSLSRTGWLACVQKRACYKVTARGKGKGKKRGTCVCLSEWRSASPPHPSQLPWAHWASHPAAQWSQHGSGGRAVQLQGQVTHGQLRRDVLSSPEEFYSCRLCIQEKETSRWALYMDFVTVWERLANATLQQACSGKEPCSTHSSILWLMLSRQESGTKFPALKPGRQWNKERRGKTRGIVTEDLSSRILGVSLLCVTHKTKQI